MADQHTGSRVLTDVQGTVKWFDPRKGFGFIVGPEGQDIFVHYSQIEGGGFRVLRDNATVNYDAEHGDKGWHATRVKRVDDPGVHVRSVQPAARNPRRTK
jgi:CspA family cold shock protein